VKLDWLLLLWLLPAGIFKWTSGDRRRIRWRATGAAFGLVVVPASSALYSLYYLGPVAAVLGLVGLPIMLVHTRVLSQTGEWLGFPQITMIGGGDELLSLSIVGGIVWMIVYASLGWMFDSWHLHRRRTIQS